VPHGDSQTGTPVTLVVPAHSGTGNVPPPTGPTHVPFTGFDLVPALAVAAALLAAGSVLASFRRPLAVRAR
jgi:hypothetical protein